MVTQHAFCWRHSLQARLTPGRRRAALVSGEASSSSWSWSWSWSAMLPGLLSMMLLLRLGAPLEP